MQRNDSSTWFLLGCYYVHTMANLHVEEWRNHLCPRFAGFIRIFLFHNCLDLLHLSQVGVHSTLSRPHMWDYTGYVVVIAGKIHYVDRKFFMYMLNPPDFFVGVFFIY